MTEIKIEKKKPVWPWIILSLALVALIVYFLAFHVENDDTAQEVSDTTETINVNESNSPIMAYVSFVQDDQNKMTLDHSYTNEALLKLTEATRSLANSIDYNVQADLDKVQDYADKITIDPFETTHAENIRKAADILTGVYENMQKANYPGLSNEVAQLRIASTSIEPGVLTLDQRDAVKGYFNQAAEVLRKMVINQR